MLLIPRHREKSPVLLCEFKASLVYSQNCPRQRNIVSKREREREYDGNHFVYCFLGGNERVI